MVDDKKAETLPVGGHTVIPTPKNVDLPPGARDNPPTTGHTIIKGDRDLDEPTAVADEIAKKHSA